MEIDSCVLIRVSNLKLYCVIVIYAIESMSYKPNDPSVMGFLLFLRHFVIWLTGYHAVGHVVGHEVGSQQRI